jgi:hypothetical protein
MTERNAIGQVENLTGALVEAAAALKSAMRVLHAADLAEAQTAYARARRTLEQYGTVSP